MVAQISIKKRRKRRKLRVNESWINGSRKKKNTFIVDKIAVKKFYLKLSDS